ncbi:MAG: hypothetical protein HY012_01300 [Acidobacteria bacterium]|nr:hypothetical protein [Acidobacteriota bacterium]
MDSAETVAVIQPRPRAGSSISPGIRKGAAAPQVSVAAPQKTASTRASEAEHAKRRTWLMFAAVVIVALLAAAVLKRRGPSPPSPQEQTQQQAQPGPQAGSGATTVQVPTPPAPAAVPPDVQKSQAEAEKAAEEAKKESANIIAETKQTAAEKRATGLNLEFTATGRATVVLTPDSKQPSSYQMQPGTSVTARAGKEVKLFTDNAGALQWKMNGKPQPALGTAHTAASVRITAAGVETLWSGNAAALSKKLGNALGPMKSKEGKTAASDSASVSRGWQQELKAHLVRLRIEMRGIPPNVDLAVYMDGQMLLRRAATKGAPEAGPQRAEEDRVIPPGGHEFQVRVGRSETRMGLMKSVTGEFAAGQMRVLLIHLTHESGGRGERIQNQLVVELR